MSAVAPPVRYWLRTEGAVVFVATLLLYRNQSHGWLVFAVLFLAPDLSFVGYLAGPRLGAVVYNAAHTYIGPIVLAGAGFFTGSPVALTLATIWTAHIGFDRGLGYGLKYPSSFSDTHLGRIGPP